MRLKTATKNAIDSCEQLDRYYRALPNQKLADRMMELQNRATLHYLRNRLNRLVLEEEEERWTTEPDTAA